MYPPLCCSCYLLISDQAPDLPSSGNWSCKDSRSPGEDTTVSPWRLATTHEDDDLAWPSLVTTPSPISNLFQEFRDTPDDIFECVSDEDMDEDIDCYGTANKQRTESNDNLCTTPQGEIDGKDKKSVIEDSVSETRDFEIRGVLKQHTRKIPFASGIPFGKAPATQYRIYESISDPPKLSVGERFSVQGYVRVGDKFMPFSGRCGRNRRNQGHPQVHSWPEDQTQLERYLRSLGS
jgi:hypothetical protein